MRRISDSEQARSASQKKLIPNGTLIGSGSCPDRKGKRRFVDSHPSLEKGEGWGTQLRGQVKGGPRLGNPGHLLLDISFSSSPVPLNPAGLESANFPRSPAPELCFSDRDLEVVADTFRRIPPGVILARSGACMRPYFRSTFEVHMSGHSKWATIKHKKGALDAKRGKIFTRLLKEIAVAAKGGGNPDTNARLRTAVAAAKAENMPQDNIKRAIQRGMGELEGVNYEEITFEGYGPGGVAVIVETLTDNRNRTVSEIRHSFSKNGGNLGESGSVRFMFSKKGVIAVEKSAATEEQLMDIVLEHGGEDLNDEGDTWEIITDPASYEGVLNAVKAAKIPTVMSEVTMIASTYTKLEGTAVNQMVRLLEALEDFDDTQNVYSNFDMDAEQMAQMAD
jgi:YebC/PmpR family DNA-binding regulatory protein